MHIFESEKSIQDSIVQNTAVSFLLKPEKATQEEIDLMVPDISQFATAEITDKDLYYHKSILVTTSWNANDDVFMPEVVWRAKSTPVHKPTNLNHESSRIVGHMTGSWAIDAMGNLMDDNLSIENLPKKFHILTGSVIYKKYHNDEDYEETVANLIKQIEEGTQFVSMECSLKDFAYAIQSYNDPTDVKIINRNQDTAFLTRYLRAYGGDGVYENYKVGRVLRDISFIGKAYTPRPANKESIIFTSKDMFDFANASFLEKISDIKKNSVLSNSKIELNGDHLMSDILQEQNKELKDKNQSLAAEVDKLKAELAKADVQKYEVRITELESLVEAAKQEADKKAEDMKNKEKSFEGFKAKADELEKEVETLKAELAKVAEEKTFAQRVSLLVDAEIDKTLAEEKVKTFTFLNDEQFAAVAKEVIAANKKEEAAVDKTKVDTTKEITEAADLDNTEVTDEADSASASETTDEVVNEQKTVLASLQEKLRKNLSRGDK